MHFPCEHVLDTAGNICMFLTAVLLLFTQSGNDPSFSLVRSHSVFLGRDQACGRVHRAHPCLTVSLSRKVESA